MSTKPQQCNKKVVELVRSTPTCSASLIKKMYRRIINDKYKYKYFYIEDNVLTRRCAVLRVKVIK